MTNSCAIFRFMYDEPVRGQGVPAYQLSRPSSRIDIDYSMSQRAFPQFPNRGIPLRHISNNPVSVHSLKRSDPVFGAV